MWNNLGVQILFSILTKLYDYLNLVKITQYRFMKKKRREIENKTIKDFKCHFKWPICALKSKIVNNTCYFCNCWHLNCSICHSTIEKWNKILNCAKKCIIYYFLLQKSSSSFKMALSAILFLSVLKMISLIYIYFLFILSKRASKRFLS